jgi:hypothetical protein
VVPSTWRKHITRAKGERKKGTVRFLSFKFLVSSVLPSFHPTCTLTEFNVCLSSILATLFGVLTLYRLVPNLVSTFCCSGPSDETVEFWDTVKYVIT